MGLYIICKLCGENNSTIFTYCKKCGSELSLTEDLPSLPDDEPQDTFDREERELPKISFNIVKSGSTDEIYRITYPNDNVFIIARRSARNRLGVYAFFIIAFIVIIFWGFNYGFTESSDFGVDFISYLTTGIIQILLMIGLMVIINTLVDVRRITVYNENELIIGTIRGNLFFTRWRALESSKVNIATFRFGLFRSKGEMKTSFGSFSVSRTREIIRVNDVKSKLCISIHSLDSKYVRRSFRIDSNGQLNPLLTCLASICIIERMFRPKTKND